VRHECRSVNRNCCLGIWNLYFVFQFPNRRARRVISRRGSPLVGHCRSVGDARIACQRYADYVDMATDMHVESDGTAPEDLPEVDPISRGMCMYSAPNRPLYGSTC